MKKISHRLYFIRKTFDYFIVGMLLVVLLFFWTLYRGPISAPYLKPYIIQALNFDDNEYTVGLKDVNLELVRSVQPIRITARDISLKKNDDSFAINAPKIYLSFSLRALLKGIIAPSDISIEKPSVYIFANYGLDETGETQINRKKVQFYVENFKEFLNNYNAEEKIYPESFVNNITIKDAEIELHEVELGRRWLFSDLDFEFNRDFINLKANANTLVNLDDKIASVGFESEYHTAADKLDLEVYFSDLTISDFWNSFNTSTEENDFASMSFNIPLNGKINTTITLADILAHPDEVPDYLDGAIEKIGFELDGGHGHIAFNEDEKYNYDIEEFALEGELTGGIDELKVNNANFKLGGQKALISITAGGLESYVWENSLKDLFIKFEVKIKEFSLQNLPRFWPRYVAEPAWEWCKDGLRAGNAKDGNFIFEFGYDKKSESFSLLKLDGKAYLSDGDIYYLEGMPVVHDVYGTAKFTQNSITVDIDKGISDEVIITDGKVKIYDLDKYNNYISIDLTGNSTISDAIKLINNPPLELTKDMGINLSDIGGNVDMNLKLDFELKQDLKPEEIKVIVNADLHKVNIEKVIPQHKLGADEMNLKVNSKGWHLLGNITYDDIPVQLKIDEDFTDKKYKSKCKIAFILDNAAKKNLGIDWAILDAPNMSGIAQVSADVVVNADDKIDIFAHADLLNSELNYPYFGFKKKSGVPASLKADIQVSKNKVIAVKSINYHQYGFDITGNADMHTSGRVKTVNIGQITGDKTSAKAKISLSDSDNPQVKIDITGNSYNLIPLFDNTDEKTTPTNKNQPQENEDDGLEDTYNTDVFVNVNSLWTNPTTPIQNFAGSVQLKKGIGLNEVHMVGNYGVDKSIKVKLDYTPITGGEHYLAIDSNNAGSTLKVLRLYENMVGGTMKIEARRGKDKKFIGHAIVRDFSIQNAPVMTKLLTVASFTGMIDLIKGDGLTFTHFNAPFEYNRKILNLKKAKAEGNVLGITADGTFNRATTDINLDGVIAPAYSINRFLGKIPLVGNVLAGKDGTIFAATYEIKGDTENPDIDINSLSMLSPNSLKEWYNENFSSEE